MSGETIIIPEAEPAANGDAGVAFAAGVAAAEAAQATEEAAEASTIAEEAAELAGAAASVGSEAMSTAWAARDDVDQLRAEFGGQLDEIRGMVADLAVGAAPAESEMTPERLERESGPAPEEEGDGQEAAHESEGAGKRYGNPRWFGH